MVISVATIKDIETWKVVAPKVVGHIKASNYWLIVPSKYLEIFESVSPAIYKVLPEESFTQLYAERFDSLVGERNEFRKGWYLQQLLKLSALEVASEFQRVLLWDADTIPIRDLVLFDSTGKPIYYYSDEYHLPYFKNIDTVLGLDKAAQFSFIAQNFPILGPQIPKLFEFIEQRHKKKWFDAIIDSINFNESSGFSEYELLGNFLASTTGEATNLQKGKWSRDGKLGDFQSAMNEGRLPKKYNGLDYVAIESWNQSTSRLDQTAKCLRKLLAHMKRVGNAADSVLRKLSIKKNLHASLGLVFETLGLEVIQIGANDGVQSDPLRSFFAKPGKYQAVLVEPIEHYATQLRKLYQGRPDIRILQVGVGRATGRLSLFHIDPNVALNMNGDGPMNNWALGQGSSSRATVVYWIYKNAFRGENYRKRIGEWRDSIQQLEVDVITTSSLISDPNRTLLVVDVQGMEEEVILGLEQSKLPRWIVLEDDLGNPRPRNILLAWGYRSKKFGLDWLFERD